MDKRIQKAKEIEALESLAESAKRNAATLEDVLSRLDRIESMVRSSDRNMASQPQSQPQKGGR